MIPKESDRKWYTGGHGIKIHNLLKVSEAHHDISAFSQAIQCRGSNLGSSLGMRLFNNRWGLSTVSHLGFHIFSQWSSWGHTLFDWNSFLFVIACCKAGILLSMVIVTCLLFLYTGSSMGCSSTCVPCVNIYTIHIIGLWTNFK